MDHRNLMRDSAAWRIQVMLAFAIALGLTTFGIFNLPLDGWMRGYLLVGLYFTVSSSFGLAKTLRDLHEGEAISSRIEEARTQKMLREYGEA